MRQTLKSIRRRALRFGAWIGLFAGVAMLLTALYAYGNQTICNNGKPSPSSGQGTCSWNGGVDEDATIRTLYGQQPGSWISWVQWPLGLVGGALAGGSLVGLYRDRRESLAVSPGSYLELAVRVEVNEESGYSVSVKGPTGALARQQRGANLPLDRGMAELARLMEEGHTKRIGSRRARALEQLGQQLFELLFEGPTEKVYRQAINYVRANGASLRIVLHVDDVASDLPWEFMYDPGRGSFLALSAETSIVRFAKPLHATRPIPPGADSTRVLVMGAAPAGTAPLDLKDERERIAEALGDPAVSTSVTFDFVEGGTLEHLREALDRFDPHVFYFSGHGKWDPDRDDGVVLFEDRSGHQHGVTGRDLGVLLNRPAVRLAVFNSCDAGRSSKLDRFAGIASSLVAQGVPAALGMQFRFDDRAACIFGSAFLAELARSRSIDNAVAAARVAVFSIPNDIEWATPVLTTRVLVSNVLPRVSEAPVVERSGSSTGRPG